MDKRERTSTWYGLNRTPFISDGELRDMKNIVGEAFPYLKTRGKEEEFKFAVAVPGIAGDGYVADTEEIEEASAENMGDIYHYTPSADINKYLAGGIYRYVNGGWALQYANVWAYALNQIQQFSSSNLELNDTDYVTSDGSTSLISGITLGSTFRYQGEQENRVKGMFYKRTARAIGYAYFPSTSSGYAHTGEETVTELPLPSAENENTRYYYTGAAGAAPENIIIMNGETRITTTQRNIYYYCRKLYRVEYTEAECGYVPVTQLPEVGENGVYYRLCSSNAPVTDYYYTAETDFINGEQVFFAADGVKDSSAQKGAENVLKLPTPSAEGLFSVYVYKGTDMTKENYLQCVYKDKNYYWEVCERPNVAKNLTLREYIDGYKGLKVKSVLDIHEHLGIMAVMFSVSTGAVYLLYDGEVYGIPTMNDTSCIKMVSCGEKLFLGESGAVFDAEKKSISTVGGKFSFEIPCDIIELGTKVKASTLENGYLYCVSQDGAALKKIAAAANVKGLEVKLTYKKKEYSATVQSASATDAEMGHKTSSGDWIILKYTVLKMVFAENITIGDVSGDYLYIKTVGLTDVTAWKNRLWGYERDTLRGTALEIFNGDGGIDWTRAQNNETDAIRRKMWQGGDINAICAAASGIMCFHQNYIDIVQGNTKSTLYAQQTRAPGIESENKKSLAVYGDSAYYLSHDGVYRTSGGSAAALSEKEKISGSAAAGIVSRDKYYLSVKEDGGGRLYIYDVRRGMWHIADEKSVCAFTELNGKVYMTDGNKIYSFSEDCSGVEFMIETQYREGTWQKKKYKEIDIGARLKDAVVEICPDGGEWAEIAHVKEKDGCIKLPLPSAVICEDLRIRIKGTGECELRSIERVFELI